MAETRTRLALESSVTLIARMRPLVFAWMAVLSLDASARLCAVPGEPIQWRADYCMLKMETDDEVAVSGCIETQGRRRFRDACASNAHFKKRMCTLAIHGGSRTGTTAQCVKDPDFQGRTVRRGGVGG